jgi:hypothetical protein
MANHPEQSTPVIFRPYMSTMLALGLVVGMIIAMAYFDRWEYLGVATVVVVLAGGDYFSRQARIEGGRLTFENKGVTSSSLAIDMARIREVKFRAMSVDICDDHGTRMVMAIGWFSGRQLDHILAHVRRDAKQ